MTDHPFKVAFLDSGAADDVSQAIETYTPFVTFAVSDITSRNLDRVFVVYLVTTTGYRIYHYDPDNVAAEDGVNVILDTNDRPFVLQSGVGTGKRARVRVATTANITIATALNNGDTLDDVTLATNDLVLVKDQTTKSQNGVYVVGVSPARAAAFDTYDEHAGAMVAVSAGSANEATLWFCSANAGGTLGSTDIEFTRIAVDSDVPGEQGPAGADGSDPGILLTWDTGTTDADPGAGKIRANHASLASASVLYISKSNRAGSSIATFLAALDDSTNTAKGTLILTKSEDETQATVTTGAVTDATGYVKLAIAGHSGATAFSAADPISFQHSRTGDAGAAGSNGTNGAPGVSGTSALTRVRAVATSNVTIASALENGDSLDGVTLVTSDLVLLTAQSSAAENGVYVVASSGAASRHTDFDAYDELPGTLFSVMEGTAKADTLWRCTSNRGGTIGSTAVAITEITSGGISMGKAIAAAIVFG